MIEDIDNQLNNPVYTDVQIAEIVDAIDSGCHECYVNPETYEFEIIFNEETLSNYGISWNEDEEDDETEDIDSLPSWQKEMYLDVKAQMKRINSWKSFIRIEKPESFESFKFMEHFVDSVLPEGRLKEQFWQILNRRHPFREFNHLIHNCQYREDWFQFKQKELEEYVRRQLK